MPASNVHPKPARALVRGGGRHPARRPHRLPRGGDARAHVRAGETVLVTGVGAGSRPSPSRLRRGWARGCSLPRARTPKLARARELGAAGGANYRTQDWAREILAQTGGVGPDVAIDSVGGATFARAGGDPPAGRAHRQLRRHHRPAQGVRAAQPLLAADHDARHHDGKPARVRRHARALRRRRPAPGGGSVFPLAEAAAAHRRMEEAGQFGKIVLGVDSEALPCAPACWHPVGHVARLLSLDALRGITVAAMVLVNNPGTWRAIYPPLRHADWHGWTPTDLVFPFFLFIVGTSVPFLSAPTCRGQGGRLRARPRAAPLGGDLRAGHRTQWVPVVRVGDLARPRRAPAHRAVLSRRRADLPWPPAGGARRWPPRGSCWATGP